MAITKTIDIDVNSSNAEKNISKLNGNLTNLSDATVKVKDASKEFGLISEGTAQTLDKVQSVTETAVSTYKSFSSVLKSFGIIQKITTAAQYVWNAAMAANPIGALVAVVVALVSAGYALVRMFQASSAAAQASADANKKLNQQLQTQVELQKKLLIETELQRDSALKMAKASGASAKEIRKLSEELANQEVAQKVANAETLRAIFLEARRVAGLKDSTDAEKATAKAAFKAFEDANNQAEQAILNRRKLAINNRVEERQEQTDANKKAQEEDAKHLKQLQDKKDKARADERKKAEDELKAFNDLLAQKRKIELDSLNASIDAIDKAREENINRGLSKDEQEIRAIKDKYFTLIETAKQNGQETLELEIAQANELNDVKLAIQKKKQDDQKIIDDKEIADAKAVADAKVDIQKSSLDALGGLIDLAKSIGEKNKGLQRAALIAESAIGISKIIINTQAANAAARLKYALLPGGAALAATESLLNKVSAGIGIAANVAATAKGLSALGGGGATGGGGSNPASGGGGGSSAPQFNLVGQSSTNQLSQTIANQQKQPIKTYVVAGDVTTQQGLDRNAVQTSTFGG